MSRILLVHWDADESAKRAAGLRRAGYEVDVLDPKPSQKTMTAVARRPPDTLVIDMSRAPARGRDLALWLRGRKGWRSVPIIFIACDATSAGKLRALLPDAGFATWRGVNGALRRALTAPPKSPASPGALAGYSGTPLPRKLGIKPESVVGLINAPDDFERTLGDLPPGTTLVRSGAARGDVRLLFVRSIADLSRRLPRTAEAVDRGVRLWIVWPKQASGLATDLKEPIVRREGLATGLVDFKIAAIDATWSGLCFARRRDS